MRIRSDYKVGRSERWISRCWACLIFYRFAGFFLIRNHHESVGFECQGRQTYRGIVPEPQPHGIGDASRNWDPSDLISDVTSTPPFSAHHSSIHQW